MSSDASEVVVQMGKLLVHIAENGHSFELECDEYTLVEAVQQYLESFSGIPFNDQLLLCLDMKLESQRQLSFYKLPSDDREVYLFNKARMRSNSSPPQPEQAEVIEIPDPQFPSSSNNPHPLDDATDPALKALPSYERQFRYHYQRGHVIYRCTQAKYQVCQRLLREQKVQERALEIARGNLDHLYRMILQNYTDFVKFHSQQHRSYANLLMNFGREIEKLRSCKLLPSLQMTNRKCLLDFVREENLRKMAEDFSISQRQFENKVSEFKQEFRELKQNAERLLSSKASFPPRDLELTINDHQRFISEQKSIMQALSKDVNTVKKLVDDCLTSQLSSSLRPHDAVSALGPMYDGHEKIYLPKMQACDRATINLLDFCKDKKNEMNFFVHDYMQKIAYIQYTIKDVRFKFSVFTEALERQTEQFEHLKVIRGIGPAYRTCLAEVVRRKASMKLYMGMAGQLAERLAMKREAEIRRREEFLKLHSAYIPRDVLASMGLYDTPNQCDVNITPFDCNLLDIDVSDIDCYAPEYLVGLSSKSEKHGSLRGSFSPSTDNSQSDEDGAVDPLEKYESEELFDGSELVEIAGTSRIEVENARLKADLASAIARICLLSRDFECELLDDNKVDGLLNDATQKTVEALHQKDEYAKHLKYKLKINQEQCKSYEKRIKELEHRLSDQYLQGHKLSANEDASTFANSSVKIDDSKSEISGDTEDQTPHLFTETMDEASCDSSSLHVKLGLLSKQGKVQERLDENMTDSSGIEKPQLDSSMLEPHHDEGHLRDKDGKLPILADGGMALATSSIAVSMSQPSLPSETADPSLDSKVSTGLVLELQNALTVKSNQLTDTETKLKMMMEEVSKLARELGISSNLLDESQMNCAYLENCLHEAREEAQTHLCAADRRASEYSAVRASAVKIWSIFERLRTHVSSSGVVGLAESLRTLAQSLSNSVSEIEDDGTAEFRDCIRMLAEKVGALSRLCGELRDRHAKVEATNEQLKKELEEKKEMVNTLYIKHQLEKQANKENISFGRLEVHEITAFILSSAGHYEAINRNCHHYYLSEESVALFADPLSKHPSYIVGQIVHIERHVVRALPSNSVRLEHAGDQVDSMTSDTGSSRETLTSGSTSNAYGLPVGCEYFIVTIAILPDTNIHSPLPSGYREKQLKT